MPKPITPNYVTGVGSLVTYRHQFEEHILGTNFRHNADAIDVIPNLVVGSTTCTNVLQALEVLATASEPPVIAPATQTQLGVIKLTRDLGGTNGLFPIVIGLQGRPISTLPPTVNNVLTWNGSAWIPQDINSSFIAGGDLTGNTTNQYIQSLSGANNGGGAILLTSNSFISSASNQPILKINSNTFLQSDSSSNITISGASGLEIDAVTYFQVSRNNERIISMREDSTDYIQLGDTSANTSTVGLIRTGNSGSGRIIVGLNNGGSSFGLLSSDNNLNTALQAPINSAVILNIAGTNIFQASSSGIALGNAPSYGSGVGVAFFENASVNPSSPPSNGAILYANDGYMWIYQSNGIDFQIAPNSTSVAGGDLTGTYPNPTIAKLQGKTVSASSPSNGQVLEYNGSAWVAANPAAGGDLTGTYPNPTIAKLQGVTVTASSPSTGQVLEYNGSAWVPTTISVSNARAYFGTGADGVLVFDGTSTVLGLVPTSSKYTMTRNINATNLTVNVGVTIETVGNGIFCTGTLTNNGTIDDSGSDGSSSGAAGGGASSTVFFGGGSNGGISGPAVAGQSFSSNAAGYGGAGGSAGAAGGALNGGGTTLINFPPLCLLTGSVIISQSVSSSTSGTMWGGSGGGGGVVGGIDSVLAGGGGGGGGGFMPITCATLSGNGLFRAVGGNGGPGTANAFPSGGGGGGGGGVIIIAYGSKSTWVGTTNVNGGSGGTGGASGGANGNPGGIGGVVMFQG